MPESDPYWTDDVAIGEIAVSCWGQYPLRLQVHRAEERGVGSFAEFFAVKKRRGVRDYFHAVAYYLAQRRLHWYSTGELRQIEVGNGRAWYYRTDRVLMLREAVLFEEQSEANITTFWLGFERYLLEHLHDVKRIVTPAWEPEYDSDMFQRMLQKLGYRQGEQRLMEKEVER